MLHFLIEQLKGTTCLLFAIINAVILAIPVYLLAVLKLLIPIQSVRKFFSICIIEIGFIWIKLNNFCMKSLHNIEWDIQGLDNLQNDQWYLISTNHQSWADVLMLQNVFGRRIPFLKFFVKDELKWVPIMGLVWWALDCPFMKRYSKEYLAKHPEMKGKDLETTRKACQRFKEMPISVISFIEGTRFTEQKRLKQASPYQHLLKPKAGGLALVMSAMGEQFTAMLDVTFSYNTEEHGLWQFWCGKVKKISVRIKQFPVPAKLIGGDYENDPIFRTYFQDWLHQLWLEKDLQLKIIYNKKNT